LIYVFDSSSLRSLQHIFPAIFETIWEQLKILVNENKIVSTREAFNELDGQNISTPLKIWLKTNKHIFRTPEAPELKFVAEIFKVPHFQSLIGEKQRLKGNPVADPFVIACAMHNKGTVVTEELMKPHAAKIPNVCEYFKIPCINLETFMNQMGWKY